MTYEELRLVMFGVCIGILLAIVLVCLIQWLKEGRERK
jgi:hypothetical protein